MAVGRQALRWLLAAVAVIALMAAVGCVGKVTRAFFLPDQRPESLPYMNERTFVNVLPERLDPWQVEFRMYSLWREADKDRIKLHDYSIDIRFVLPDADPFQRTSFTRPADALEATLKVTKLYLGFPSQHEPRLLTPLPSSDDPRHTEFFTAAAPKDDDSVTVSFTVEEVDPEGTVRRIQDFRFTLVKFEERARAWFTSH